MVRGNSDEAESPTNRTKDPKPKMNGILQERLRGDESEERFCIGNGGDADDFDHLKTL